MAKTAKDLYEELMSQGNDYQQKANDLLSQYENRGPFEFNLDKNTLYKQYRDQYMRQGHRAMQDTMGQAAALTGGYANSYAQNVGSQAYDEYLQKLNAVVPELYAQARGEYDKAGQGLMDRYNIALNAANNAYGKARDALGDERYEEETAYNRDWQQRQWDYQQQQNAADREWQQKQWDYNNQQNQRSESLSYAKYLLNLGVMPSADVLAKAGITEAEARAIIGQYAAASAPSGGTGSGRGTGSNSGGGRGNGTGTGTGNGNGAGINGNSGDPLLNAITGVSDSVLGGTWNALTQGYNAAAAAVQKPLSEGAMQQYAQEWAASGNPDSIPKGIQNALELAYGDDAKAKNAAYQRIVSLMQSYLNRQPGNFYDSTLPGYRRSSRDKTM